jgi:uncharacterized protein (TIGR02757 family)
MMMKDLKGLLDHKADLYNRPSFIADDPVSVPHLFNQREDIEIAGFFSAILAWGRRSGIIRKARELMQRMDDQPFAYITGASAEELSALSGFVHRTFNQDDAIDFVLVLRSLLKDYGNMENLFLGDETGPDLAIFHRRFVGKGLELRHSRKHISNTEAGSAAKRLNMYLRWMVRDDDRGVDFGIWKKIKPSGLLLPLDVHSGRVARRLGLLNRKQNDYRAVLELTGVLREFDPQDPCRYDFALFGLGVFENF